MPQYNYRCKNCGKEYIAFMQIKELNTVRESKLKICPNCKSGLADRIIKNSPLVIYKGDGFTLSKE